MAILLVLASHSLYFLFPFYYRHLVEAFGIFGSSCVEILFVLSGFLIGQLIIKEILRPPSWRGLGHFYVRRWFRTPFEPFWRLNLTTTGLAQSLEWMVSALRIATLLAALMYLFVEKPVLKLRERLTGSASPTIERAPAQG